LLSPSGQSWIIGTQADTVVTIGGSLMSFGSRAAGFQYENVATSTDGHTLRLDATFLLRPWNLRVSRHFAIADGSPTFEVWTTFQSAGANSIAVANMNAFQVLIPA